MDAIRNIRQSQILSQRSIGTLRVDGIPARFDIGFPLPENKGKGDIAGYHCWAEFYARKTGWIPVDISEAWKLKQKEDYFFGSVDTNRVQLSTGRDIALPRKQDGPALNYFVYPKPCCRSPAIPVTLAQRSASSACSIPGISDCSIILMFTA